MKDLFPGHFQESDKNIKKAWEKSLFVFDANILLNLYRYSDTTRKEFLRILDKLKDRIWLPHRAAEEYLNNRLSVIDQQEKSYDDTIKSIESLKQDLENSRQHPFVSKKLMDDADEVFDKLCHELKDNKSVHTNRINQDEIKDSIADIFKDRVGSPYKKDEIEKLITEGEERYKEKIPPGFKDNSKSNDSDIFSAKCRKYGDLIVWNQVIDKAIESNKGVILVTDDKKEDWWERSKGKTVGPRPELVKEFKDKTNSTFHMYQADRFLELAIENLNEQINEGVVEEIRETKRKNKIAYKDMKRIEMMQLRQELESRMHSMMLHEEEYYRLNERMRELEAMISELPNPMTATESFESDRLTHQYTVLSAEYNQISNKLENSSIRRKEAQMHVKELEQKLARCLYFDSDL